MTCPACGFENPAGFAFCGRCGASLAVEAPAAREERKVVTCLFCDLVGFTSRAEALDPEEVRALLRPYHERVRAELERRGGTVEKFIGDAVMAVFGAPVVHEDDPERAVRAALAIRDAIGEEGELHVRIGIASGEALVNVAARPEAGEGMAAGDVVNTAARLETAAAIDSILVDETTYRATRAVIEYARAEPVEAKGKSAPVEAWQPREARARFGVDVRQHGAAPLVGRERELESLVGALDRARREESCQLVTLVGVPGIGKSRLVFELFGRVEEDEELIFWRQGRSLPYGEGASQWALGEMVKAQAGILESDSSPRVEEKLGRAVRDLVADDPAWVERHLRPLVGLGREGVRGEGREESFAAWRRFFEALAARRPTVLVFEDLQWADDGLLDFVEHLVDWATTVALLVVCTARPEILERRPGWGGGKLNALLLSLSPLAETDAARLLASLLDQALLPAETQAALLERAGGNPLYAEQFARLYLERGTADELPVPETLQGIVAARVDGLPVAEKPFLRRAAVVGKVFWAGALGGEAGETQAALHALERKDFVRRARSSSVEGETEYAFRHALVREVAYGQIPRGERADLHRAVAEWIEKLGRAEDHAELVANHYLAALELARAAGRDAVELAERARLALREAGDRSSSLHAFPAAARFYAAALERWPADDPERAQLLFRAGESRMYAEEAGEELLEEAAERFLAAGDREAAARALSHLGTLYWRQGRTALADTRRERAQELLGDAPPSEAKAEVLGRIASARMVEERSEEAVQTATEAIEMAEALGLERQRAASLNDRGTARVSLGDLGGIAEIEESVAVGRRLNDPLLIVRGLGHLAELAYDLGEVARSIRLLEECRQQSERWGISGAVRWADSGTAFHDYRTGRWDEALSVSNRLLEEIAELSSWLEPFIRHVRGLVLLGRGDVAAGEQEAKRQLDAARAAQDPQSVYPALLFSAQVALAGGRGEAAGALADELVSRWEGRPTRLRGAWAGDLGHVLAGLGRLDDLRSLVRREPLSTPWVEALQLLAAGKPWAAADRYAELGMRTDEAHARVHAARRLAAESRRAEADAELERALAFWRSVAATRYVREGEALLARSA